MRKGFLLQVLAIAAAAAPVAWSETNAAPELTIVQWNVENLFDADDDPANKGDDPFTPRGWEFWTEDRYRTKLEHLADLLHRLNGDIVCMQEVENRRVLNDLNDVLKAKYGAPYKHIIHREGTDHRGIDVAIFSRLEPVTNRWISPVAEQRDVLIAEFRPNGAPLTVLCNHWKSRIGPKEVAEKIRNTEAGAVKGELKGMLSSATNAAIMLVGDFNDDFNGPTLIKNGISVPDREQSFLQRPGLPFLNLHQKLPESSRGTIYYHPGKTWNSFDSISISRAMVTAGAAGWKVVDGSYEIVRFPEHVDSDGHPIPFRRLDKRDKANRDYHLGYSDHFPLRVRIVLKPAA